jgi:hypothetical protein
MPEECTVIGLDLRFTAGELEQMKRGVIPVEMEDKWFVYWQDDTLHFHRSWTGFCVYVVRFECDESGSRAVEATVNREPEQYRNTDDGYDASMVPYLIDVLLLRRPSKFPARSASRTRAALEQWSQVGRAGFGEHPGDEPG